MPTYQYACTACDHRLEAVQSFADDPLTQCPECEGRLRKLFGSVGIVFKGPGFYRTDSRAGSNGNGSNGKANGKSDGTKSESSGATSGGSGDGKAGGKELATSSTTTSTSTPSSAAPSSAASSSS